MRRNPSGQCGRRVLARPTAEGRRAPWRWLRALALLFGLLAPGALAAAGGTDAGTAVELFPSSREAFARVLSGSPAILAVGEYHQLEGAPRATSALVRFTRELLPALQGRAGALVVETWMTSGKCGEVEKQAAAAVKKTTQRPDSTGDEVVAMMDRAFALGLKNHILLLDCDEHRSMLGADGELDPEKSLSLVRRKMEEKALECREKGEGGTPAKALVLYGGALHNDRFPGEDLRDWTFGPTLAAATDGGYVELDLLVPEWVAGDEDLKKEPWFERALAASRRGHTVLVTRAPGVFSVVFPAAKRR